MNSPFRHRLAAVAVAAWAGLWPGALLEAAESVPPPNIVLIVFDDLGLGDLGFTHQNARGEEGKPHIRTPRLDELAANGLRFTQAYASDPVCAPTRCSLMTGRDQGHALVRENWEGDGSRGSAWGPDAWEGQFPLPPGTVTLASLLQQAGYTTGGFGKWGLGTPLDGGHPLDLGFDTWSGYLCQRQAHNYYPSHLWRDRQRRDLENGYRLPHHILPEDKDPDDPASYAPYLGEQYAPDLYMADAREFIRSNAEARRPFFCFVPTVIPHAALQVPEDEPSLAEYRREFGAETPYTGDNGYLPNRTPVATYAAMITRADRQIGELIDELAAQGVLDNTLIIVTSDNGPTHNGGVQPAHFDSTAGLRGSKASLFQGGIRVPLVFAWSGRIAAGETDTVAVTHDLLPTLADLLKLQAPAGEGVSLVPTLAGRPQDQTQPEYRYWEINGQEALLSGSWKALRKWEGGASGAIQLFDLAVDPTEQHDVAAQNPEVVERLTGLFAGARETPLLPVWALGPQEQQEARARGCDPLAAWEGKMGR